MEKVIFELVTDEQYDVKTMLAALEFVQFSVILNYVKDAEGRPTICSSWNSHWANGGSGGTTELEGGQGFSGFSEIIRHVWSFGAVL